MAKRCYFFRTLSFMDTQLYIQFVCEMFFCSLREILFYRNHLSDKQDFGLYTESNKRRESERMKTCSFRACLLPENLPYSSYWLLAVSRAQLYPFCWISFSYRIEWGQLGQEANISLNRNASEHVDVCLRTWEDSNYCAAQVSLRPVVNRRVVFCTSKVKLYIFIFICVYILFFLV